MKEFAPQVARLTVVADPDGLLLEEGILEAIRERGFELIPLEDHVSFRYAYESKFRSHWDSGEHTDLIVVLRSDAGDLGGLPYDLLRAGRKLSFNLGDIFPDLAYPVVTALDRADLDLLYEAQRRYAPGQLGENATKEFVLRHVFEIAPELIKQPSDLLRVLLRRHYCSQRVPTVLDKRFLQLLSENTQFDGWPLETVLRDREAFFAFLQERWPMFLDREVAKGADAVHEDKKRYSMTVKGPVDLPFEHHDIRVYIDNLFAEGILHPVVHDHANALSKSWVGIGVQTVPTEDRTRRLSKLLETLRTSIPGEDSKYTEWFQFARGWAEIVLLVNRQSETMGRGVGQHVAELQSQVDAGFTAWLLKRYAGLVNLPPIPPVMLHHLPRFIGRQLEESRDAKIALIVVDGLAMDQWLVVRTALASRQSGFTFREHAVFAWIPSLTSVSRQAIFAGKAPIFFPNSVLTTDKEPTLWSQFWADHGLTSNEVVYAKGLGDGDLESVSQALSHPKVKVAGLVIDKVDKIMHGMELGTAGMHNQVDQWARQSYLSDLFGFLLRKGYRVYLTSDHGNVESEGCGRPVEGVSADLRGERVRIYPDAVLRRQVKEQFSNSLEWDPIGLPEDYFPLLSPARKVFMQEKECAVSHGGISLEELIVPLVQIEREGK